MNQPLPGNGHAGFALDGQSASQDLGTSVEARHCLSELNEEFSRLRKGNKAKLDFERWGPLVVGSAKDIYSITPVLEAVLSWSDAALRSVEGDHESTHLLAKLTHKALSSIAKHHDRMVRKAVFTALEAQRTDNLERQTDPLTGLLNRTGMISAIDGVVSRRRPGGNMLVLWCDVIEFRRINLDHGKAWGDYALQALGRRLKATVRDKDLVGRMHGSAFAVCCIGAGVESKDTLGAQVRACVTEPLHIKDCILDVDVKMGVAKFPECGRDALELLNYAESEAMGVKQPEAVGTEAIYADLVEDVLNLGDVGARPLELGL